MVGLFAFEIGQFEVAPVVQSRSLVPAPADRRRQSDRRCVFGHLLGGADNPLRLAP